MRVTVIGGGSWGTALGQLMAEKGLEVSLLLRDSSQAEAGFLGLRCSFF
jgi:glycerol-3-phosphate dehydrogenase (NAD(P)+)